MLELWANNVRSMDLSDCSWILLYSHGSYTV